MKKMSKKVVRKKTSNTTKMISFIIGLVGVALTVLVLNSSVRELITKVQLKKELKLVESELETLENRQKELTLEKSKLEDPTYVQNYARGTHLLSKSEEQVFILPKGKK